MKLVLKPGLNYFYATHKSTVTYPNFKIQFRVNAKLKLD